MAIRATRASGWSGAARRRARSRGSLIAIAVALAATAHPVRAGETPGAPAGARDRALALLGAIDRPPPAEAFRALGPEGEAALEEIARSGALPLHRARALEVLATLRSARAEPLHRALAADRDAPRTVRRAAVRGLGRLVDPARAPGALRPFLARDRDPAIRAAAAEALAAAAPRASCADVRAQARAESPRDRLRFRRALAACERR